MRLNFSYFRFLYVHTCKRSLLQVVFQFSAPCCSVGEQAEERSCGNPDRETSLCPRGWGTLHWWPRFWVSVVNSEKRELGRMICKPFQP